MTVAAGHQILWPEFCEAFHSHHIPAGVMKLKLQEFMNLKQGLEDVPEYAQKFNYLTQYGSYHVDTDEKKRDCFKSGLNLKLQQRMAQLNNCSYNELVNAAIVQEDAI